MLVSHRHRFIYTKTLKTGGTSVESFFERFCMDEGQWEPVHGRPQYESSSGIIGYRKANVPADAKWWNHMPAERIRQQLGDEVWESYFKFCVIHNPFGKCISAFDHFGKDHMIQSPSQSTGDSDVVMSGEQQRFLSYLLTSPPVDRDKYVIDNKLCLDDFIRHEMLEADVSRICLRLGLPFDSSSIPFFKTGIRRAESTISRLYTPQSRKIVEDLYAFELEQFGYEFPNS